jgi:hypothetical protein
MSCIRRRNKIECGTDASGNILHSAVPHRHMHDHEEEHTHEKKFMKINGKLIEDDKCDSDGSKIEVIYSDEQSIDNESLSDSMKEKRKYIMD